MAETSALKALSASLRSYLRFGFILPMLAFATAFIALAYDTDVVNDTVKVQAVCEARVGAERQAAANAVGVELAQVDCTALAAVQARRVVSAERFNRVFGLLLLLLTIYFIASRSVRRVPVATLAGVFTVMALAGWKWSSTANAPVLTAIKLPFIALARGVENNTSVFGRFTHALLLGGFPEELYKALPLLLLLWATMRSKLAWRSRLGVADQVEGIAISVAAAAGFVFAETYAPMGKSQSIQLLQTQMAVPHVVGGIAGQIALSVIAGYFISLAVRPPKSRLLFIPAGLLIASMLHAVWSAFAGLGGGQSDTIIATVIRVATFFTALLLVHLVRITSGTATVPAMQARSDERAKAQPSSRASGSAAARTPSQASPHATPLATPHAANAPVHHTPRSGSTPPGAVASPAHASKPVTPSKAAAPLKRYTPMMASPVTSRADAVAAAGASKPVAPPTISMKASDIAAFAPSIAATGMTSEAPRMARATPAASYVRLTTPGNTFIHLNPGNVVRVEQWPGMVAGNGDGIVAQLLAHPDNPAMLGLFNQSNEAWVAWRVGDEFSSAIGAGEVLPLLDGLIIRTTTGDVHVSMPMPGAT